MSFEVIPPRLKIDDLIRYFGYENNARGYTFIFDMINYYDLPVYVPIPTKCLHEGDYSVIPALMKYEFVICKIAHGFFNERNFGDRAQLNYEWFSKYEDLSMSELAKKLPEKRRGNDFLYVSEVIVSGNRIRCFMSDDKGKIQDNLPLDYGYCYAKGTEVLAFHKKRLEQQGATIDQSATIIENLFPNLPKRDTDNKLLIVKAAENFIKKHHSTPGRSELWVQVLVDAAQDYVVEQNAILGLANGGNKYTKKNFIDNWNSWTKH